jgi:hypothetical protein
MDAVGSRGRKPKLIKAFFCPTLHFTQPVAVGDDNTNRDLSGYAQYDPKKANANYHFGIKQADQGALNYSPDYEGTELTYLHVMAGEHGHCTAWVNAVSVSTHTNKHRQAQAPGPLLGPLAGAQ